ncbi:ABC transporter permease, partial [Kitasatospora paranensis]
PRSAARVLAGTAFVFLLSSLLTFGLGAVSDANPAAAVLGETATPADIVRLDHEFGLDRPLPVQYGSWLLHAVGGDLGRSWFTTVPVSDSIAAALPVDLSIAGLALLFAVLLGAAAGIGAALSNGGRLDRAVTAGCTVLGTLPAFVVAIGLITLVAVQLRLLPSGGYVPFGQDPGQWLRFALLPALALSLDAAAGIARQLRTSLVGALRENYATGAVMRGLSPRRVLFGHVLRNAAGPAVTVLGMSVPMLIGGAVVTERIFNLPGIAQLSLRAAEQHDVPVIQGTLLVTVVVVLVANLAVDAGLLALNPAARRAPGAGAVPR